MAKTSSQAVSLNDDWQVQQDMRTLADAEAIRKDPKRLERAKKAAQEKLDQLKTVATTTAAPGAN